MYGQPRPILHGRGTDFRSLLKDVEERYSDAFAELWPGALIDLKMCVHSVEAFLGLLFDGETRLIVKMAAYSKAGGDVSKFCGYYARWLGRPLMERLKHEIYGVLEQAVSCGHSKKSLMRWEGE